MFVANQQYLTNWVGREPEALGRLPRRTVTKYARSRFPSNSLRHGDTGLTGMSLLLLFLLMLTTMTVTAVTLEPPLDQMITRPMWRAGPSHAYPALVTGALAAPSQCARRMLVVHSPHSGLQCLVPVAATG